MLPQIKNDRKLKQMYIRKDLTENRKKIYNRVFSKIYEMTGLTPTEILQIAKQEQKPKIVNNQIEFKELEDRTITELQYDAAHFEERMLIVAKFEARFSKSMLISISFLLKFFQ